MDKEAEAFRILLAEDDPVSRSFLSEVARACGAEVTAVADGTAALAEARRRHFDLLILDHHLPGLHGDRILRALRADPAAPSRAAPALATSAAGDPSVAARLHAAGFAEVLPKPMAFDTLRNALRRFGCGPSSALDDEAALRACGSAQAMTSLRALFAQELAALERELETLRNDATALDERLHRLGASCGFCGAIALAKACARLRDAQAKRDAFDAALAAFRDTLADTRAALAGNQGALEQIHPGFA